MPLAAAFSRVTVFSLLPLILLSLPLSLRSQDAPPRLDVPYVPTPEAVVQRMLEMAEIRPDDYLIDLGSGDGRIAISAVRDHAARKALGVDLNPQRIREARQNAERAEVTDKVEFEQGDLFEKDISKADVLTLYLLPQVNLRLRPVILDTLEPGTRVVSHAFSMQDWEADQSDVVEGNYIYLWIVPAKVEGRWQVDAGGRTYSLDLHQHFQQVEGTASAPGVQSEVKGSLHGDELRFTLDDQLYVGKVEGNRIRAVPVNGAMPKWAARRS
ncbi:class I SAM-dependent methyltransferase [Azomonas macrocytogenes]|uniref:Methyltransferase domain-containing protein n=1 Tax=Azomonas macrocytogenes TaxID=69962 RepID=A0A839T236_AZOMA|nr:methyltransferase domain-containing protein [Azomonas macrocytogenes]MBB3103019.1 hypothetical protein [Azomonas macrocytogenes]